MNPQEIFQVLAEEEVAYALVGGLAATVHGASLTTLDTDLFEGLSIPVLSLDQLIRAKSVLDQRKDREHLDQLLAIRKLRGGE